MKKKVRHILEIAMLSAIAYGLLFQGKVFAQAITTGSGAYLAGFDAGATNPVGSNAAAEALNNAAAELADESLLQDLYNGFQAGQDSQAPGDSGE